MTMALTLLMLMMAIMKHESSGDDEGDDNRLSPQQGSSTWSLAILDFSTLKFEVRHPAESPDCAWERRTRTRPCSISILA